MVSDHSTNEIALGPGMRRILKIGEAGGGRLTGLHQVTAPNLESISRRRTHLWSVTLFLLISAVSILTLALIAGFIDFPFVSSKTVMFISIVGLVILFSFYAFRKEIELRSLTRDVVDEQMLATALANTIREAQLVAEGGDDFHTRVDPNQMVEAMLDSCVELLGGMGGSVMLLQGEDELHTVASSGSSAARGATVAINEGIAGQVAASHEPVLVYGVFDWSHYRHEDEVSQPTSSMCVPLIDGDRLVGVLNLNAAPERTFTKRHLRAMSVFGGQAGKAIARAQAGEFQRRRHERSGLRVMHDPLTGLPNRALFFDRVGNALARRRPPGHAVVVLFLDLDDFKRVNDSLGHAAGDQVLIALAERLRASVRMGDSVAHFGGDEFAILLDASDAEEASAAAKRILNDLNKPFPLEGREVRFTASVGIALEFSTDIGAEDVVRNALMALHNAKSKGKGQVAVFEQSMHSSALDRLDLEHDLRHALEEQGLDVYFQPLMHIPDMTVHGFEALVRWHHPQKGLVSAMSFVPLAEEAGLQPSIDRMVLQRTCAEVVELNAGIFAGKPAAAHVNISPSSLNEADFVPNLAADIRNSGIEPGQLVLEITESVIMHDMEQAASKLRAIKSLGVRLALDDFGTGYSSLSYLRRFPVDVVKIDKIFVDEIEHDNGAAALVQAILRLGRGLSFEVVAEGIETEGQMNSLVELGCGYGQGYFLARPLSTTELRKFLSGIKQVS
jgi:diguanylate cyclase (GGDEF)-like protein